MRQHWTCCLTETGKQVAEELLGEPPRRTEISIGVPMDKGELPEDGARHIAAFGFLNVIRHRSEPVRDVPVDRLLTPECIECESSTDS